MSAHLFPFLSLEELLTSDLGFGLSTATPLQRAVCWVLEGKQVPDHLWTDEVKAACGGVMPGDTDELVLLAGVRGGKTLICAAACVWYALTADLTGLSGLSLRAGEVPRVSLVSELMDNANESMNYIAGALEQSFVLKPYLWGEPKGGLVNLRHPSGQKVAIKVIAMTSTGISLVSRWAIAVLFDEAPRMASESDGKVNLQEQVRAVRTRLVKGGRIMYVGSAYGDKGFVYDLVQENWQKPNAAVTVVRAYAFWMNPYHWTPERCAETQRTAPEDYDRDVLCNFQSHESQLFPRDLVDRCMRREPLALPREDGARYFAAMDPAATTNAWTFAVAKTPDNKRFTVVYGRQWRASGGESLAPKAILEEICDICQAYGVSTVLSDQWSSDAHRDLAQVIAAEREVGFGISSITLSQPMKAKMHLSLLMRMEQGLVELPYSVDGINDLVNVKKLLGRGGNVQIVYTETADGRHCDWAGVFALLCGGYGDAYALEAPAVKRAPHDVPWYRRSEEEIEALEEQLATQDELYDDERSDQESWLEA